MSQPEVSVVVPTCGRPESLRRCLEALLVQHLPVDRYEVIVVDDGGQPAALLQLQTPQVRILRQTNQGPASARNLGAAVASGRWLAFTDDDCIPDPGWLPELIRTLQRCPEALVGGRTVNALPHNPYSVTSQAVVTYLQARRDKFGYRFFGSNNFALSREAFLQAGGFDAVYRGAGGEDRAFCATWQKLGGTFIEAPKAIVEHAHPHTLHSFWKQHEAYGEGAAIFHKQHAVPSLGGKKSIRFYAGLVLHPLQRSVRPDTLLYSLLLVLAQVATLYGVIKWQR